MTTQIREANESEVVTTKPQEHLYCILHEQMVQVQLSACGIGHVTIDNDGEIDFCCFPDGYAFCPPQDKLDDLPEDWAAQTDELSDDERAQAEAAEQGMWNGWSE